MWKRGTFASPASNAYKGTLTIGGSKNVTQKTNYRHHQCGNELHLEAMPVMLAKVL